MKKLNKLWKWFDGKKTVIGYIGGRFCLTLFAKQHIDPSTLELMQWGFDIIGGAGVMHKITKAETTKRVSMNITKMTSNFKNKK